MKPEQLTNPVEINLNSAKDTLTITYDNGAVHHLTAELLRVESPSAEVQGHGTAQKTTPIGKHNVRITAITPVGHYAIRLAFSDGHDTGIYSWGVLYRYGCEADKLMTAYRDRLTAQGLKG